MGAWDLEDLWHDYKQTEVHGQKTSVNLTEGAKEQRKMLTSNTEYEAQGKILLHQRKN